LVYISSRAAIGDNTVIGSHAVIEGRTTIGKDNQIFSHAVIGSIPQDLKYRGEDVELIIGNSNKIREFTLINPGTEVVWSYQNREQQPLNGICPYRS